MPEAEKKEDKKKEKKDPFQEIIEVLEKYEEGTPPRNKLIDMGE